MKYIDTEKLIAEIESRKEKWLLASRLVRKGKDKAMYAAGKSSAYTEFLSLVTSLQREQPEVDSLIRCELPDMVDDKRLGLCYCNQFGNHRMTIKDVREIARHIYEFGLNARKED